MRRLRKWLLVPTLLLAVTGCGAEAASSNPAASAAAADGTAAGAAPSEPGALSGELIVFAAASLTDAFEQIGDQFEQAHPAATVTFNFAGSQTLATQITEGAPADVFASASKKHMDAVGDAAATPQDFATNKLAIVVEPGNPQNVMAVEDVGNADLKVVLAAEDVPAGQYAREALDKAGVEVTPVSLETDVRAVLTKVALGEADAGIVYESDVLAGGDEVVGIEIPEDSNIVATYPITALSEAPNPDAAAAFVDYVLSEDGQTVLKEFGFAAP